MQSLLFDIQRFSIHDGPGIRTVVFFKGCNLVCPWCQNPESIAPFPELAYYPERCTGTNDCIMACHKKAISSNGTELIIDRELCKTCGGCTVECVSGALKIIGKKYSVQAVFDELLRDIDYYKVSGGGVTFSGGEPTLHTEFITGLLQLCRNNGIHTNIETNGYFRWEKFKKILPLLDLIYFDIKITDHADHHRVLSAGNETILGNMEKLIASKAPVEFRIPLIPNYTDREKNLLEIISLLKKHHITRIHLLPYHSMGEQKAERIDCLLPKLNLRPYSETELTMLQQKFGNENISTVMYR